MLTGTLPLPNHVAPFLSRHPACRALCSIPGSTILLRYIRNSHQNDPWRTVFELLLFAFAVRTVFSSRTRTDQASKNFVKLSEKVRRVSHALAPPRSLLADGRATDVCSAWPSLL